jgi:hypothetical protein
MGGIDFHPYIGRIVHYLSAAYRNAASTKTHDDFHWLVRFLPMRDEQNSDWRATPQL